MELSITELIIYTALILVVIAVGLFLYRKEILFLSKSKEVRGVITNWMSATQKGKKYFYPMIEFETMDGQKITFRADERCENQPMFPPGTEVRIKYLPSEVDYRKVIYPNSGSVK